MDPMTAAMLLSIAVGIGTQVVTQRNADKAQRDAKRKADDEARFANQTEATRVQQLQNTAASSNKKRSSLVNKKNTDASAGPAGNMQVSGNSMTASNGGINANAGTAGTF